MNFKSTTISDENALRTNATKRVTSIPSNTRTRALTSRTANVADRAMENSSNSALSQQPAFDEIPNIGPDFSNELKEFGLSSCKDAVVSVFPFESMRIALQSKIAQGQVTDSISLKWDPKVSYL